MKRHWLIIPFIIAQVLIFSLAFGEGGYFGHPHAGGSQLYLYYSSRIVDGELPYRDFDLEYPPLALAAFSLPRIFASTPSSYTIAFAAEMLLLELLGLVLIYGFTRRLKQSPWAALSVYTLALLAIGPIIGERYDVMPAVMVLGAIYAFSSGRYSLAWVVLGLATMTKVYPAVIVPIFALSYVHRRDYRALARGLGVYALTTAAVALPVLILSPGGLWHSYSYHLARGLHSESSYASLLLMGQTLGLGSVEMVFGYGSVNVASSAARVLANVSPFLMALGLFMVYRAYVRKKAPGIVASDDLSLTKMPEPYVLNFSLLAILVFMMTSKVLSPQFILWLFPLVPLVIGRWRAVSWLLFLLIAVLTRYIFPWHYSELMAGQAGLINVLFWRNLLFGVMAYLLWKTWPRPRSIARPGPRDLHPHG